jgi:hypothetical protein
MKISVMLKPLARDMVSEAVATSQYKSPAWRRRYPRVQIPTVADQLSGAEVKMPPTSVTFKQANRTEDGEQFRAHSAYSRFHPRCLRADVPGRYP